MSITEDRPDTHATPGEVPGLIRAAGPAACAAWDDFLYSGAMSVTTRYGYRTVVLRFLGWLEPQGIAVADVTPDAVERYLEHLAVSPAIGMQYRRVLRKFFATLVARGVIADNPAARARLQGNEQSEGDPEAKAESLEDQFARFSPVERQATVDAAAAALLFHDIYVFTEGRGGSTANVDLCENALQAGARYGITPFSWADGPADDERPDGQGAATAASPQPAPVEPDR